MDRFYSLNMLIDQLLYSTVVLAHSHCQDEQEIEAVAKEKKERCDRRHYLSIWCSLRLSLELR